MAPEPKNIKKTKKERFTVSKSKKVLSMVLVFILALSVMVPAAAMEYPHAEEYLNSEEYLQIDTYDVDEAITVAMPEEAEIVQEYLVEEYLLVNTSDINPLNNTITFTVPDVEVPYGDDTVTINIPFNNPLGASNVGIRIYFDSRLTNPVITGMTGWPNPMSAPHHFFVNPAGFVAIAWVHGTSGNRESGVMTLQFNVTATDPLTPPPTVRLEMGDQEWNDFMEFPLTVVGDTGNITRGNPIFNELTVGNLGNIATPADQTPATNPSVLLGTALTWDSGEITGQNFLGWVPQATIVAQNIAVGSTWNPAWAATPPAEMPNNAVHYVAVWGNPGDGGVGNEETFALTVGNLGNLATVVGQTPVTNAEQPFDSTLVWYSGAVENQIFLGWVTPAVAADIEAALPDANIDDFDVVPASALPTTMPDEAVHFVAVWGNQDGDIDVTNYDAHIVFHMYDGSGDYVVVGISVGETLDLADLAYLGIPVAHIQGTVNGTTVTPGAALWGWFTDESLDASGRTRNGLRRPVVGEAGFNLGTTFTQSVIDTMFDTDGYLNLYVIWSLWGDVNDDDQVTAADATLISQHLFNNMAGHDVYPNAVNINLFAANVRLAGTITAADATRIRQYLFNNMAGFPVYPGAIVLGRP